MPTAASPNPDRRLPEPVRTVCGTYLALLEEQLPGLVEGLYLHGSLGFGEWYDGRSDVDFVAVASRRPDAVEAQRLEELHERLGTTFPRPSFDGFYATWDDLAESPYRCPDVCCILGGTWEYAGRVDVNPVTWHELARHGVTVRGPRLDEVRIWTDDEALRAYTRDNLATYWAGEVAALERFPAEAAKPEVVAWYVLGVARLHHLLATGRLTSKSGAGQHVVETFGERWRPLVAEALCWRVTGERAGVLPDTELGTQVVELASAMIDDGLRVSG